MREVDGKRKRKKKWKEEEKRSAGVTGPAGVIGGCGWRA
jgi:hypothetical protein